MLRIYVVPVLVHVYVAAHTHTHTHTHITIARGLRRLLKEKGGKKTGGVVHDGADGAEQIGDWRVHEAEAQGERSVFRRLHVEAPAHSP